MDLDQKFNKSTIATIIIASLFIIVAVVIAALALSYNGKCTQKGDIFVPDRVEQCDITEHITSNFSFVLIGGGILLAPFIGGGLILSFIIISIMRRYQRTNLPEVNKTYSIDTKASEKADAKFVASIWIPIIYVTLGFVFLYFYFTSTLTSIMALPWSFLDSYLIYIIGGSLLQLEDPALYRLDALLIPIELVINGFIIWMLIKKIWPKKKI